MKRITVALTEDQIEFLEHILGTEFWSGRYDTEGRAFIRRITTKLAKAKTE